MGISPNTKHNFSVSQIALFDAANRFSRHKPKSFLACDVEVYSLFVTSDDPDQNFVDTLIFKQISAAHEAPSNQICMSSL